MTAPRLFLDRSVGTHRMAAALRAEELDVETIADRYGQANIHVRDEQWIAEASRDGRILVSADKPSASTRLAASRSPPGTSPLSR